MVVKRDVTLPRSGFCSFYGFFRMVVYFKEEDGEEKEQRRGCTQAEGPAEVVFTQDILKEGTNHKSSNASAATRDPIG